MLEEFFQKNAEFLKRLTEMAYDATIGLAKSYQEKTVTLAKLHAAQIYMKFVQGARKQIATIAGAVFCAVIAAVGLVVIPLALILLSDLSRNWKLVWIAALGVVTVAVPLTVFFMVFSEKAWLKFSKSQKIMEDIISEG